LRDTSSGAERELRGAARRIACFAASAHSASPVVAYAESGGLDPKIHVHQVDTLERVATLEGCASLGITALAFSRDGRYLAVASAAPDPTLALRVAATGETLVKMDLRSEATRVAFDPFDAHRLLVTHARGGVLAAHPGVTLHVVDETYHRVTVTPRPLRVEQESALTCAAWSPDGRVVLGDERGAVFVANPDDGSLIPPPESVRSAVRAALAAEVPQRAVPPPGMRHAWAYAGAGPISSVAFSATRVAVALADSNRLLFFSPFVAHADGEKSKNPRLDIGAEPPARLVKTVALGAGSGGASGIAAVAFAPSFDELVATTTEGAAFVATGFLDGKGILAQEDQPSPFGPGMRTIRESEGDPPVFVGRSGSAMETDAAGAFVSRVMGRVTSGAASAAAATPDASDASAATSAASSGAVAPALSVAAEAAKQDALKRIEHLRRRLGDVIARNDEADELTRVPRGELLMDETFKAQLVAEGETRVRELRARLERENLVADYMSSKIVAECWDTMQTHGSAIVALNTPGLMVHKYPLKAEDKTARLGRRIAFLRRVELAEQEHFKNRGVAEKEKSGGEEDGTRPEGAFEGDKERAREVASSSDSRVDARSVFDLRVDAPLGEGAAVSKKPSDAASSNPNPATDSYEACLYDPSALYPPRRKISQFSLLQMTVREAKAAFNESFASTEAEKQKFVDKIAEINARIVDIRKELAGHTDDDAPLFECVVDKIEQEEYVLSVKDSELKSTRWLSPEERAAAEAAAEAERERIRAKGENPPEDRALREMMGGRLEKAEEVGVPDELPKPDWMIEIDKEDWNDEQRKQGREFENKAKVYREELAKRRVLLAAELVRLHEESAETVVRHDEMLAEFLVQKLATDQRVAEMEADVVALACEVETALHDDEREEERLALAVDAARETREKTRAACSAFQLELDAARKKRDACDAQNQKLDREFKRDFADADDLFDALHALYKRRKPRKQTGLKRASSFVSSGGVSSGTSTPRGTTPAMRVTTPGTPGGSSVTGSDKNLAKEEVPSTLSHVSEHDPFRGASGRPASENTREATPPAPEPLDSYSDRPEGTDDEWWFRLVEARDRKIAKEEELRVFDAQMREMGRLKAKLVSADDAAVAAELASRAAAAAHAAKRRDALYDLSLPVRMLQTYVEALEPEFELGGIADLEAQAAAKADAVLIDRSVVEHLNEVIQGHGAGKVETLVAIKDFKKGIYDLQWEKERLAMEGEDASHKIKEIQMARAPVGLLRDVLVEEDLARGPPPKQKGETLAGAARETDAAAQRRRAELASLEQRLEHAKALHARRVAEKRKELLKTRRKKEAVAEANEAIATKAREMDGAVRDVAALRDAEIGGGAETDNSREAKARKMRALVTQSKLRHIAKAQEEEMLALRAELERARLRTFPSFVERPSVRLPDIKRGSRGGRR
jgi:hypothetical protein